MDKAFFETFDAHELVLVRFIAIHGWEFVWEVAAPELGLPSEHLKRAFPQTQDLLKYWMDKVHKQTMADAPIDPLLTPEEVLFESIMIRFDCATKYKPAYKKLPQHFWTNPLSSLCLVPGLFERMGDIADRMRWQSEGFMGAVQIKMLAALYLHAWHAWLSDETEDLSPTMAVLNQDIGYLKAVLGAI